MEKLNLLYSRSQIAHRVRQLAEAINRDYQGRELVLLGVMKGSFVFVADLIRLLDLPLVLDFMGLSSYGAGQQSSGRIVLTREPTIALQDRDVLLVEDIADTGLTAAFALDYLRRTKPHSLKFCVLMDRTEFPEVLCASADRDSNRLLGFPFQEGIRGRLWTRPCGTFPESTRYPLPGRQGLMGIEWPGRLERPGIPPQID